MLDAQALAALLQPRSTTSVITLGTVTGQSGASVRFVFDGEDPASPVTRTAATLVGFPSSVTVGARVVVARVNASFVVLGVLQS